MAHAPTDGVGIAARAAPRPPRALVDPLAPRLHSVVAVAEEEWQSPFLMARAPTDGVGVAARATFPPPPALVVPLALLSCSIDAFAKEEWQRLCRWGGINDLSCGAATGVRHHGNGRIIPPPYPFDTERQ